MSNSDETQAQAIVAVGDSCPPNVDIGGRNAQTQQQQQQQQTVQLVNSSNLDDDSLNNYCRAQPQQQPNNALIIGEIPLPASASATKINIKCVDSFASLNQHQLQQQQQQQQQTPFIIVPYSLIEATKPQQQQQQQQQQQAHHHVPIDSSLSSAKQTSDAAALDADSGSKSTVAVLEVQSQKQLQSLSSAGLDVSGGSGGGGGGGGGGAEDIAPPREQWAHKIEFLLAIIGFSVDLGNIWRCERPLSLSLSLTILRSIIAFGMFVFVVVS